MKKGKIFAIILIIISSIYLPFRLGDPESGYNVIKPVFGEDWAKLLFPIGEASIVDAAEYVEILPYLGEIKWEGRGHGSYRFLVLNEHNRNIMITDFNITGPRPVTRISVDGTEVTESVLERVKFDISGFQIKPPIGSIIEKDTSQDIDIPLDVTYEISILKGAVEELDSQYVSVWGLTHVLVSYEILGKNIEENISKSVNVHFLFKSPS